MTFDKVEENFSDFFETENNTLSENEKQEIVRFLDHGEYGLAAETTFAIYKDNNADMSYKAKSILSNIFRLLHLDYPGLD